MKQTALYILMGGLLISASAASAQRFDSKKFSVKVTGDIGLNKSLRTTSDLTGLTTKSSSSDLCVDFGWRFWKHQKHSLDANIGIGYGWTSMKANLPEISYNYAAPSAADEDKDTYIRYYDVTDLQQKIRAQRWFIPLYLTYRYQLSSKFGIHAFAGIKESFNVSSKVVSMSGSAYSYGVYPQYDDLKIDASYLNNFGHTELNNDKALKPELNNAMTSYLVGAGVDFRFCDCVPLSVGLSVRYEGGFNNMFKGIYSDTSSFTAESAPVQYTVAEGQQVMPLSNYFKTSKLSRVSLAISLSYHF